MSYAGHRVTSRAVGTDADTDASYQAQWARLRTQWRWAVIAFIGYMPGGVAIFELTGLLGLNDSIIPIGFAWFAFVAFIYMRPGFFRCPRCGKFFYIGLLRTSSPFRDRCIHCNLKKGSLPSEQV